MRFRRLIAVARKESLHILRDPRSLALGIALPALLIVLFGYALSLDVDDVPFTVLDRSGTPESRAFVAGFDGSRYFRLLRHVRTAAEADAALDRREAVLALDLPPDFAADLLAGRRAAVSAVLDGADANTALLALAYAEEIARRFSDRVRLDAALRAGAPPPGPPLELRPRVWYNPALESRQGIVPGLIAVIMAIIAALLSSLTVAREWETGTMEQLVSTPLRPAELVIGKLLPYFAIGMADLALAVLAGLLLFGMPLRGSATLLVVVSALFLAGAVGFGMLAGILTRSQLLASQVAMLSTFLPAFLLSGFMYSIENMPAPVRVLTHVFPARYFVTALKGIFLKGAGVRALALEIALLAAFAAAMILLAIRLFRKRLP